MKSFIGFEYNEYFKNLFIDEITPWLTNKSVESIYPINKMPGGILIDRILSMIDSSTFTLWECTTLNPNVLFELGYSLGIKKPFFILFNKEYDVATDLPVLLKTQWGIWYKDSSDLISKLENIISSNYYLDSFYNTENELSNDTIKINSIGVVIDSTHNYDSELKIINKYYKGSKIDLIDIELYRNISHLIYDIGTKSMIICLLYKIDHEESHVEKTNKTINALKLLAFGIVRGLFKKGLILQDGSKTYSDIENFVKFYDDAKEFETNLIDWNKNIVKLEFKEKFTHTRIRVPNLGKLITRNHIIEYLKSQLFLKHIFLRAPSGYGKTGIILNLIQSVEYKTVWFSCDDRIKNIIEIINDLLTEINKFQSEIGKLISALIFSFNNGGISREDFINYFLLELKSIKERTIIILDDVHNLNNKNFSFFFDLISETHFDNVSFIFIGREEIELEKAENIIKNCITLNKEDIVFKESEIKDYFKEILSINLTGEESHLLSSKTEGWIASISLLQSIVIQKGSDVVKHIIDNLKGNKKRIYDYFADIVYDNFDGSIQNYLKMISIPFKLIPKDVSFILEISTNESVDLLNILEKQNSFLFNYEDNPSIFKFHTLFREFLIKKYEEEYGISKLIRYKSELANYYFENKDYFESVIFGIEGKNYEVAVRTIDYIGNDIINEGMGEFIFELIYKVPEKFYNDDYAFLMIKGRTEEFFTNRNNALQTYIKARNILQSKPENKREYNLVSFFILNSEIHQNADKTFIPSKLRQIIEESVSENDIELFSYAFGLYSQIRRISLMTRPNLDSRINLKDHEDFIKEIDVSISKLENSNLNSKNLYISQLLIDKAMVSHSLSWYNASEFIAMERLSSIFKVNISNLEKDKIAQTYSAYFSLEQECFSRAMEIAIEMNNSQLKANILVNRSQTYDSRNNFFAFSNGLVDENLVNKSLNDLNEALNIYRHHKNIYGIATVYNNIAQTYLLKNDKQKRDEYANLAVKIANEFGYPEILKSSKDILNSLTINETIKNSKEQINKELEKGITKENEDKIIEKWIRMLGDISEEEKTKRIEIFKLQNENIRLQKILINNWCKLIEVFHTNLPLNKHSDTSVSMVKSYMDRDETADKAHFLSKQIGVDFSESLALFNYCKKFDYYSNKLYDQVEICSNEFIAKYCIQCKFREL